MVSEPARGLDSGCNEQRLQERALLLILETETGEGGMLFGDRCWTGLRRPMEAVGGGGEGKKRRQRRRRVEEAEPEAEAEAEPNFADRWMLRGQGGRGTSRDEHRGDGAQTKSSPSLTIVTTGTPSPPRSTPRPSRR